MKNKFPPTHKRKFPYFKLLITCKIYFLKTHGIEERNNNSLIKQNRPKTKIFQLTVWHVCECLILGWMFVTGSQLICRNMFD